MAIGFAVGDDEWFIGSSDFVVAFFSTITAVLEPDGLATRFPHLTGRLFDGELAADEIPAARAELQIARAGLAEHAPSEVVWDYQDRNKQPPWGDDIAADITSLANYFRTADDSSDVIERLDDALITAERRGLGITIRNGL